MILRTIYNSRSFKRDIVFIILILMTPLCIYLYAMFPENKKSIETALFVIESNYYEEIQAFIYHLSVKFIFVMTFILWFLTCKHWWRMVLLIPIIFNIYQLLVIIDDEIEYVDGQEFWFCLLISSPLIILLFYISKRLNYYSQTNSLNESLNKEISQLMFDVSNHKSTDFEVVKQELIALRREKPDLEKGVYIEKLLVLRDKLNQ